MPTSETPSDVNEPKEPAGASPEARAAGEDARAEASPVVRGSRWVDYDTHELLNMISELEDERGCARASGSLFWSTWRFSPR